MLNETKLNENYTFLCEKYVCCRYYNYFISEKFNKDSTSEVEYYFFKSLRTTRLKNDPWEFK